MRTTIFMLLLATISAISGCASQHSADGASGNPEETASLGITIQGMTTQELRSMLDSNPIDTKQLVFPPESNKYEIWAGGATITNVTGSHRHAVLLFLCAQDANFLRASSLSHKDNIIKEPDYYFTVYSSSTHTYRTLTMHQTEAKSLKFREDLIKRTGLGPRMGNPSVDISVSPPDAVVALGFWIESHSDTILVQSRRQFPYLLPDFVSTDSTRMLQAPSTTVPSSGPTPTPPPSPAASR